MRQNELSRLLADHAARHRVPGAALAVLRDGEIAAAHFGTSDVTTGEPVSAETRFAVASITKPLVATVVGGLAAEGRVSLDDPVAEQIPELAGAGWATRATVRDLMANRSRVPLRAKWEFELEGDDEDALSRCASLLSDAEEAAPVWSYSNVGWCLLGRLIETATGLSWEEAMRTHLFDPVGMNQTTFALAPVGEPRARGHEVTVSEVSPVQPWVPRVYCSAGTSLLSTASDLAAFAGWFMSDPSHRSLLETHAGIAIHGWLDAWCLGWGRFDWDGGEVWGWDGVASAQRAVLRLLPDRSAAVALMTNGSTGRAMSRSLFPELLEEIFGLEMPGLMLHPRPGSSGDLDRFAGVYAWPDRRYEVRPVGDRLLIESRGRKLEALPTGPGIFLIDPADPDNPTVTFTGFEDGLPTLYAMLWAYPRTGGE